MKQFQPPRQFMIWFRNLFRRLLTTLEKEMKINDYRKPTFFIDT
jgi:hypothetical protein